MYCVSMYYLAMFNSEVSIGDLNKNLTNGKLCAYVVYDNQGRERFC